jgi:2',3'-cyclic-nucleotide 2'-phosphodiesterase (5'-nucleotidase family)
MSNPDTLRIITTNDFYGSFFARATSYGTQPGARSLVNAVARLREQAGPSLWVDAGDFAQGGPLAPASGGSYGFAAVGELGIDIATLGNHEFDWGEQHAARWCHEGGFPVVMANYDLGLPPSALLPAGPFAVGVIGLTHPAVRQFNDTLRKPQPAPAELIPDLARDLRARGADAVLVAIHDGVDWTTTAAGPLAVDTSRIEALCGELAGHIDVLIGGHTLGRYIGELAGIPFVQPWAFGAEVGVIDRRPDGTWAARGVLLAADEDWQGAGSAVNAALTSEIVGELAEPLIVKPLHSNSLAEAMARGLSKISDADVAVVFPQQLQTMQSPIDGAFAYLPAGPVSEADVLRVVPFVTDHVCQEVFVCELTRAELDTFLESASGTRETDVDVALSPQTWGGPAVVAKDRGRSGVVSLAMASLYSERPLAEQWIGRSLDWTPIGLGLREALRADVSA